MKILTSLFLLIAVIGVADIYAQTRPQPILVDEFGAMRSTRRSVKPNTLPRIVKPSAAVRRLERSTFDLMNAQRTAKGLTELKWNDELADIARYHSANMASYDFFSHKGQDGMLVDDRADLFGLTRWDAIGENIAYLKGFPEPEETAVEKWLGSPSHRRNMLSSQWRESAIGVAMNEAGAYYFTQIFILRR